MGVNKGCYFTAPWPATELVTIESLHYRATCYFLAQIYMYYTLYMSFLNFCSCSTVLFLLVTVDIGGISTILYIKVLCDLFRSLMLRVSF